VGAAALVYLTTADRSIGFNDVTSASLGAWRIATSGQPFLDGLDLTDLDFNEEYLWVGTAGNGHTVVLRSPGAIAVGVPAYVLARTGGEVADFVRWPGAVWAALLATATLLLFWRALRPFLPAPWTTAAVTALGFATPVWTVAANGLYTHTLTVLAIAGMAWGAATGRWWLVGVFGGLGLWGRLHVALVVAVLGLGLAVWRRRPSIAVVVGAVSGAFLVLAAGWSRWLYGAWVPQGPYASPTEYAARAGDSGLTEHVVNQLGLWVSADRGLLVWTPVLLLLLPAVVRSWRELPDWTRVLAGGGLAYCLVQGQLNHFDGGSGFYGYRLTLETLACLFPLYATAARHAGRVARHLLGPLLGLQVAAMAIGATSEGFLVLEQFAWTDNSLALGLRTFPALWLWLALMALVGHLAARVWRGRGLHRPVEREAAGRALLG
jgi:alpha-1,2-mannosyltransferase